MIDNKILPNIQFFIPPFENKSIEEFINRCYKKLNFSSKPINSLNPFLFFVVVYNLVDKPVGFLQGSFIYERAEIEQIFVLESYRGSNYGKILVQAFVKYATEKKCDSISLEVNVKNIIAINLYKKFDFEIVALREKYYNNKEDAYLMVRRGL